MNIRQRNKPHEPLSGKISIPGDKSISHRAIIFSSMAIGVSRIDGLLESDDIISTINCMKKLGARISKRKDGIWEVFGVGVGGFTEPENIIDLGNSGTSARLISGAVCTSPIKCFFTGDDSLRKRPMDRIIDPLTKFGADFVAREKSLLPICILGANDPVGIDFTGKVASAQVKSAVLIAGLNALGETRYIESVHTRDHTERMLSTFGAEVEISQLTDSKCINIKGLAQLDPQEISIPGDPSSAAFPMCAALMVNGSEITIPNICQNPTRIGLQETLCEMGADISVENKRIYGGEPVADLSVRFGPLRGVNVPPERAPSMIDEYPILAILASTAEGKTIMKGIKELRVKESDRIKAVSDGLRQNGIEIEETEDSLTVFGKPDSISGGSLVKTYYDHRIAMSFLCLDLVAKEPVRVDSLSSINTSFKEFLSSMKKIGAKFD